MDYLTSAELYDPATEAGAAPAASAPHARSHGDAAALMARCWWREDSNGSAT